MKSENCLIMEGYMTINMVTQVQSNSFNYLFLRAISTNYFFLSLFLSRYDSFIYFIYFILKREKSNTMQNQQNNFYNRFVQAEGRNIRIVANVREDMHMHEDPPAHGEHRQQPQEEVQELRAQNIELENRIQDQEELIRVLQARVEQLESDNRWTQMELYNNRNLLGQMADELLHFVGAQWLEEDLREEEDVGDVQNVRSQSPIQMPNSTSDL